MISSINAQQRRALLMWSAALCIGSTMLAPLAARSSGPLYADAGAQARFSLQTPVEAAAATAIPALNRDPFVAEDDHVDHGTRSNAPESAQGIVGAHVKADMPIVPLPPNTGAAPLSAAMLPSTAQLTGVILGDRPQALVRIGELTRIMTVGDRISGHAIKAIGEAGLRLDDGSLLVLQDGTQ